MAQLGQFISLLTKEYYSEMLRCKGIINITLKTLEKVLFSVLFLGSSMLNHETLFWMALAFQPFEPWLLSLAL